MMGMDRLAGQNVESWGCEISQDMTEAYSKSLGEIAKGVAKDIGVDLQEGIYLALSGPTYETPAQKSAPSALLAPTRWACRPCPRSSRCRRWGFRVSASHASRTWQPGSSQKLTHQEVMDTTARVQKEFTSLILGIVKKLGTA